MVENKGFADQSIAKTYRTLRSFASAALIFLPLVTAISAFWVGGYPLQPSLSDYYFVAKDGGLPRTIFLIFLAFLGCVLLSYRGLDHTDNLIHNVAGIFSFGVALFPMECVAIHAYCVPGLWHQLHKPSAGLLYVSAVISVMYGGGPKLVGALKKLHNSEKWLSKRRNIRVVSAALMTIGIVGYLVYLTDPMKYSKSCLMFWIEYTGFVGFGIYWLLLMQLIRDANKAGQEQHGLEKNQGEPWENIP